MKKLGNEISFFLSNKIYMIIVSLTAISAYGFAITHQTIGIDDTAIPLYFKEGLAPAVGRWCIYILNKVIKLDSFLPWMTELLSIVIFIISVTIWCVLLFRIVGRKVSIWGYAMFSALFLSCPLISELYVYYLHNGICTAYGTTAISLFLTLEAMNKTNTLQKTVKNVCGAALFLTISLGFYESFIVVYAIGALLIYFLVRLQKSDEQHIYDSGLIKWGIGVACSTVISIFLRMLILATIRYVFDISIPENFNVTFRSVFGMVNQPLAEYYMAIKKFGVMYYLNAFCYLPITVLVIGMIVLALLGIIFSIRKKDFILTLIIVIVPIVPLAMVIVEGYATHYRASQYVPLIGAFAVFLIFWTCSHVKIPKWISNVGIFFLVALLWNQCADMNRWFYSDYLKYEDAKNTMNIIAYELEKSYDLSKPIVFKGGYLVPYDIAKESYLAYATPNYRMIKLVGDLVDNHLIEKFNTEYGGAYGFAETPFHSTVQWGITAFDGTSGQLEEFWKMHGHNISVEKDLEKIDEASQKREGMPAFPKDGYIKECEEYIIVNLAN